MEEIAHHIGVLSRSALYIWHDRRFTFGTNVESSGKKEKKHKNMFAQEILRTELNISFLFLAFIVKLHHLFVNRLASVLGLFASVPSQVLLQLPKCC